MEKKTFQNLNNNCMSRCPQSYSVTVAVSFRLFRFQINNGFLVAIRGTPYTFVLLFHVTHRHQVLESMDRYLIESLAGNL